MASPAKNNLLNFTRHNMDLLIGGLVLSIILMIIVPLSPSLLDMLLTINIALALSVILITMFTVRPLEFSVFPSLLLITTLYRLALNISSTRLILGDAQAGKIISAFGDFVVGGNFIVGFIVFIIITVVQFVVIVSGAGRVAEVSARFTLDAMPGKQMSIDAEFNSGLISETEARNKRETLQKEADFFGAMDGANKFVKGDAITGIVIIIINIIGGISIGTLQKGMSILEAVQTYSLLTIGDGLVSQVPALLISTASGILVTRTTSESNFGQELSNQFTNFPKVLFPVAGAVFVMGMLPQMPHIIFVLLSGVIAYTGYYLIKEQKDELIEQQEIEAQEQPPHREPEDVFSYFQVDPLQIEIGYNLIPLTDESQGGDLLERLASVRRQCASEMGIYVRPIRICDNLQLSPNGYVFKLRGEDMITGELMPGHYMAMDPTGQVDNIKGVSTTEPAFGLPAWWINPEDRDEVEIKGLTVVDNSTVIVTHITEFIKQYAHELLGRQEVKELIDVVKENNQALVDELLPDTLSLGEIQKVLHNLLKERVPIRDMVVILETLADGVRLNRDIDFLTDHARQAMARTISRQYAGQDNVIRIVTIHPKLENMLLESIQQTQLGSYPVLEPKLARQIMEKLQQQTEDLAVQGAAPVVLCSPQIRLPFKRLTQRHFPQLVVLSLNEISPGVEIEAMGTVSLDED
ncbi:MAG: flagellar biosynthesis protein FlhA [Clostridiales bacterium]|nr:flagellar biosynthesis protein FlhA [Clostridiales bacterium]MCF8021706.1 flagellar biosynthesis protein FlhA [Clostridiales bacterium]